MAVAACFATGTTRLLNVPQARIKETDRIACMTCELRKMGADVEELPDGMVIRSSKLHGAEVESHHDHRIAMALAIAGLNAEGLTIVKHAESAAVTYPEFIEDFQRLGAKFCAI
jgi:3-phosphoshikimate 1-carboxyvinyltransferase